MTGNQQKVTKARRLAEAGKPWRLGPDWPGRRCLAKTRSGGQCQCPAMKGKARCRIHGGLSTGPRTKEREEKAHQAFDAGSIPTTRFIQSQNRNQSNQRARYGALSSGPSHY